MPIGNNFHGMLPIGLGNQSALTTVVLAGNNIEGNIRHTNLTTSTTLHTLILRANNLNAELRGSDFVENMNLRILDLSQNKFTGQLPVWNSTHMIKQIHLGSNYISDRISPTLLNLPNLRVLKIENNYLSCNIPSLDSEILPSIPALSKNLSGGFNLSMLGGNNYGCPVEDTIVNRDAWGRQYICGWNKIIGGSISTGISSPAGLGSIAVLLLCVASLLHCCFQTPVENLDVGANGFINGANDAVKEEVESLFHYISSTKKVRKEIIKAGQDTEKPGFGRK